MYFVRVTGTKRQPFGNFLLLCMQYSSSSITLFCFPRNITFVARHLPSRAEESILWFKNSLQDPYEKRAICAINVPALLSKLATGQFPGDM